MSEAPRNNASLILPDLTIRGFRGIKDLSLSRLGRVTLVAGKNGSGKTTLLEAVQVFAARGQYSVLNGLLRGREELLEEVDEEGRVTAVTNWAGLFHGRRIPTSTRVSIGPGNPHQQVSIEVIDPQPEQLSFFPNEHYFDKYMMWLRVEFQGSGIEFPTVPQILQRFMRRRPEADSPPAIDCNVLGPSLPDNAKVARFWDSVALTIDEDIAVAALSLVTNEKVDRVAVVGQGGRDPRLSHGRRVMVKIAGENAPIPLKSLGDGATRFFALALALANTRNGFLGCVDICICNRCAGPFHVIPSAGKH